MSDISDTLDAYFAMWNETDEQSRLALAAKAMTDDAHYVDPMGEADGHVGLSAMAGALQTQFPDHDLRLAGGVDTHHERVRFAWELAAPDGTVVVAGTDFAVLAADGRLAQVTGFFGEIPAAS